MSDQEIRIEGAPAPGSDGRSRLNLRSLLQEMIDKDASDLHITAGERPKIRIDGDITDSSVDHIMNTPGFSDADKVAMLGGTAMKLLGIKD